MIVSFAFFVIHYLLCNQSIWCILFSLIRDWLPCLDWLYLIFSRQYRMYIWILSYTNDANGYSMSSSKYLFCGVGIFCDRLFYASCHSHIELGETQGWLINNPYTTVEYFSWNKKRARKTAWNMNVSICGWNEYKIVWQYLSNYNSYNRRTISSVYMCFSLFHLNDILP